MPLQSDAPRGLSHGAVKYHPSMRHFLLALALPLSAGAAEPVEAPLGNRTITLTATSELPGRSGRPYSVGHLMDGDADTAWVEGVEGTGEGQVISFHLGAQIGVEGMLVWPGYGKSAAVYTGNATPSRLTASFGSSRLTFALRQPVQMREDEGPASPGGQQGMSCVHVDRPGGRAPHVVVLDAPVTSQTVKLAVDAVLPGEKWADLAITEARPLLADTEEPLPGVEAARRFLRAVRDRRPLSTAPAKVLDLREVPDGAVRAERATYAAWGITDKPALPPTLDARSDDTNRLAAANAFLAATRGHFVGVGVAVVPVSDGTWVVGTRSGAFGDGEWVELSPAAKLDANGAVAHLTELSYSDGAPGCHDVLPAVP